MKKILAILFCFILVFSLISCGSRVEVSPKTTAETEKKTENRSETASAETETTVETTETETETEEPDTGTTSTENAFVFHDISIVLPEGFTLQENSGYTIAFPPDYPAHTDNITFTYDPNGVAAARAVTEESLKANLSQSLGGDVTINEFETETDEIDGHECIAISYSMEYSGTTMFQIQYFIIVDDAVNGVAFTIVTADYLEAFESSSDSIRVND